VAAVTPELCIVVWCWGAYPTDGLAALMARCARYFPPHAFVVLTEPGRRDYIYDMLLTLHMRMASAEHKPARVLAIAPRVPPHMWGMVDPARPRVWQSFPPCYVRLWAWSRAFAITLRMHELPERVLQLDMDCAPVADCEHLLRGRYETAPVVLMSGQCRPDASRWHRTFSTYSGGMMLLTPGSVPDLWADFTAELREHGRPQNRRPGSDQVLISQYLGKGVPTWHHTAGIWRARELPVYRRGTLETTALPDTAALVQFSAGCQPWTDKARRLHPWLVTR
jgi:hypothetical protein